MRNRAERRAAEARTKRAARAQLARWGVENPTPKHIGTMASTHNRPCSCDGCKRGPRPDKGPKE